MQVNAKGNLFHTPKGLVYVNQWGPLRHAVGDAGILGLYARGLKGGTSSTGIQADAILAFAESQVNFLLLDSASFAVHPVSLIYICTQLFFAVSLYEDQDKSVGSNIQAAGELRNI